MKTTSLKIDGKKYRIIKERDYTAMLRDINDLGKILKGYSENGEEARAFFNAATPTFQKRDRK